MPKENGYALIKFQVNELLNFKNKMSDSGTGTIDRIWTAIEKKASKALVFIFMTIIIGLVGTLFGLVYNSNQKISEQIVQESKQRSQEMVEIKQDIAVIKEKLK